MFPIDWDRRHESNVRPSTHVTACEPSWNSSQRADALPTELLRSKNASSSGPFVENKLARAARISKRSRDHPSRYCVVFMWRRDRRKRLRIRREVAPARRTSATGEMLVMIDSVPRLRCCHYAAGACNLPRRLVSVRDKASDMGRKRMPRQYRTMSPAGRSERSHEFDSACNLSVHRS